MRRLYGEVLEMARRASLTPSMARSIARKANVVPGGPAGAAQGPCALFVGDGEQGISASDAYGSLSPRFRRVAHDTGLGGIEQATHASALPWVVPEGGFYRIDAATGYWRESNLLHHKPYFGVAFYYPGAGGVGEVGDFFRSVSLDRQFGYTSGTIPGEAPLVLRGNTVDYLPAGLLVVFDITQLWGQLPGATGPAWQEPHPANRVLVQRIAPFAGPH